MVLIISNYMYKYFKLVHNLQVFYMSYNLKFTRPLFALQIVELYVAFRDYDFKKTLFMK